MNAEVAGRPVGGLPHPPSPGVSGPAGARSSCHHSTDWHQQEDARGPARSAAPGARLSDWVHAEGLLLRNVAGNVPGKPARPA